MFSRRAVPFAGGWGSLEESFTSRLDCIDQSRNPAGEAEGLTNTSAVLSTIEVGLVALLGAVVGVALVVESGTMISLESRNGLFDTDLGLSETRFRKGFLDAREDGPRSMA